MAKRNILRSGFTIVELLIVIVVIGILASITVVAYSGIQGRAHDTAVQSDLRNAAQKLSLYKVDHGTYPTGMIETELVPALEEVGLSFSHESYSLDHYSNLLYLNHRGEDFTLLGLSKSGTAFYYNSREGAVKEFGDSTDYPGEAIGGLTYTFNMYEPFTSGYTSYDEWSSWARN